MKTLVLFVLVAGCSLAADLQIVSDLQGENVRSRELIGKLSKGEFKKLALEFLRAKEITVGVIAVYSSKSERILAGARGGDHCNYAEWHAVLDRMDPRPRCPEVKEAIKIGSAILVRTVDPDCRRSSDLIQGSANPLILEIGGERFEILHASFSRAIGQSNLRRVSAQLFIRTNSVVSADIAETITKKIKTATSVPYLDVGMRADSWFFNYCDAPALFPFESQVRVPSRDEWYKTRYAHCSVSDQWPIRCLESESGP